MRGKKNWGEEEEEEEDKKIMLNANTIHMNQGKYRFQFYLH